MEKEKETKRVFKEFVEGDESLPKGFGVKNPLSFIAIGSEREVRDAWRMADDIVHKAKNWDGYPASVLDDVMQLVAVCSLWLLYDYHRRHEEDAKDVRIYPTVLDVFNLLNVQLLQDMYEDEDTGELVEYHYAKGFADVLVHNMVDFQLGLDFPVFYLTDMKFAQGKKYVTKTLLCRTEVSYRRLVERYPYYAKQADWWCSHPYLHMTLFRLSERDNKELSETVNTACIFLTKYLLGVGLL